MPRKPKRPCSYPSCPNLTEGRFCDEHQRLENKNYEKYKRDPDTKKRYNKQWRVIRNRYLKVKPMCEECLRKNKYTVATEVHHIKPLADGGTHDSNNLMGLCKSCHSKIENRFKKNVK